MVGLAVLQTGWGERFVVGCRCWLLLRLNDKHQKRIPPDSTFLILSITKTPAIFFRCLAIQNYSFRFITKNSFSHHQPINRYFKARPTTPVCHYTTMTIQKTEITLKGSIEIVSDFFFTAINSILYQRGTYRSMLYVCFACSPAHVQCTCNKLLYSEYIRVAQYRYLVLFTSFNASLIYQGFIYPRRSNVSQNMVLQC